MEISFPAPQTHVRCAWAQIVTNARRKRLKMTPPYQIFRKLPDNKFIWVENIDELQAARGRLDALSASSDADYVLFDPRTRAVVAHNFKSA